MSVRVVCRNPVHHPLGTHQRELRRLLGLTPKVTKRGKGFDSQRAVGGRGAISEALGLEQPSPAANLPRDAWGVPRHEARAL